MTKYIFFVFLLSLLIGCHQPTAPSPRVVYNENNETEKPLKEDTSAVKTADLPIQIDSTDYLIHALGEIINYKSRRKYLASSTTTYGSKFKHSSIASSHRFSIQGNIHNLKFQHIDSDILKPLTDKEIRIKSVQFLNEIYTNTRQQYLVYTIIDKDTNQDGKLNDKDIKSLYISNIDGSSFEKITEDFHEILDWKVISSQNRLYFKTIFDSNKNGDFDKKDSIYYATINLEVYPFEVKSYNPM